MTSTTDILNDTTSVQSRIDTVLGSVDRELDWSNDSGWQPGDPIHPHPYVRALSHGEISVVPRRILELVDEHEREMRCRDCDVSWRGAAPCWSCGVDRPARTAEISMDMRPFADQVEAMVRATARTSLAIIRAREAALERARRRFNEVPVRVVMGFDGSRDSDAMVFSASPGAMWVLPRVANPAAPTMAELTAAMAASTGIRLDAYQRAVLDVWFPGHGEQPAQKSRPVPLAIDGHAYRRRTKRRRR